MPKTRKKTRGEQQETDNSLIYKQTIAAHVDEQEERLGNKLFIKFELNPSAIILLYLLPKRGKRINITRPNPKSKTMPTAYITRRELFNAAHRLYQPSLSDEENFNIYGKCSNPNWHGHNYTLWITVKGEVKPEIGYIANLKEVSRIVRDEVIEKVDHRNLNLEVDFMKGIIPSTENLAIAIWRQLEPHIKQLGIDLHCIKIEETENNTAEFYGF